MRHGSRYPNKKHVQKSEKFLDQVKLYRENQSQATRTVVDELILTFSDKANHALSELGALEMRQIGERFRKRYPFLFNFTSLSEEEIISSVDLVSSSKQRCLDSARNFIDGLLTDNQEMSEVLFKK